MTGKRDVTKAFEQQITSQQTATTRIPPSSIPYCDELEEAFDAVLCNLDPNTNFYDTMVDIYEYSLKNNFITGGQWDVLKRQMEKLDMLFQIEELEEMRNKDGS